MTDALAKLRHDLDADRVLLADAVSQRATSYWNSAPMQAKAMLLPRSTDEVAEILRGCNSRSPRPSPSATSRNCDISSRWA